MTGPSAPGWALAVDFGTSNTAAALRRPDGSLQIVRLSTESDQMPSSVFAADDGLRVGDTAVRQAVYTPEAFERTPKLRLGEPAVALGDRMWPPAELVAAVLRHVLQKAGKINGGEPMRWVALTHPEGWGERRRRELANAAERAGLPSVQLVSEPVAAAAWYLRARNPGPGQRVAVFDFGGGTCDVAVLQVVTAGPDGDVRFAIRASAGEEGLGGDHIDARLADWVIGQLRARGDGDGDIADAVDDPDDPRPWLILRDEVRRAKHTLSDYAYAQVAVRAGDRLATVHLTRDEFDGLIAPDVERAVGLTRRVLDDAGTTPQDVAALYCTGGSSHIPLVHRRLTDLLGRPPDTFDDPKLVVPLGAAAITGLPTATPVPVPEPQPEPGRVPGPEGGSPPPPPRFPPPTGSQRGPQPPPGQHGGPGRTGVQPEGAGPDRRRRRLITAAVAALVLAAVAIAAIVFATRPDPQPTANPGPDSTDTASGPTDDPPPETPPESDPGGGGTGSGPTDDPPSDPCGSLTTAECDLLLQIPGEIAEVCDSLEASVAIARLQCSVPAAARQGANYSETVEFFSFDSVESRDADVAAMAACGTYESSPPGSGVTTDTGTLYCTTAEGSGNAVMVWSYDGKPIAGRIDGVTPDADALYDWFLGLETVSLIE